MRLFLFFLTFFVLSTLFGQQGSIEGIIIEDATGETLVGSTIQIAGTTTGTISDIDGKFSLNLVQGNYDLIISYISFQNIFVENVEVSSGQVTTLNNLRMKDADLKLSEVVVTAEAVRSNEIALMNMRKNSNVILDGISAAKMRLTGDATAVDAVKRVTGVTIEGGKYVYVRGLGDRYSKTMLNNADIPGLDPDKNTLQMDIFPTNLIGNITVSKNFTADMPADFTGGLLNIETIDFPENHEMKISLSTAYNPKMNLNSNFLTYEGGSLDYLGFDDGSRSLPNIAREEYIPSPISGQSNAAINSFLKLFNPVMSTKKQNSFLNTNISFSIGNKYNIGSKTSKTNQNLGYVFSLSYKNEYNYYADAFFGDYQKSNNANIYDLIYSEKKSGQIGENTVSTCVFGGLMYKTKYSKIKLTLMHLQKGVSLASKLFTDNNSEAIGQSGYLSVSDVLSYNQSSLSNLHLTGSHVFPESTWNIDWQISPTYSYSADPDIRETPFSYNEEGHYYFSGGEGGMPSRTWRYLNEFNLSSKINIVKKYKLFSNTAKLMFGIAHTAKYRNYEILGYNIQFWGNTPTWKEPNANLLLTDNNLFPNGKIYYINAQGQINPNEYQSNNKVFAFYVSNEQTFFSKLNVILGLRAEKFVQNLTGRDAAFSNGDPNGINMKNEKVIESINLFPSVNIIYKVFKNQNLRLSYSNTIGRPSFKEVSFAQIIDPVSDLIFNGSLYKYDDWDGNIKETHINNFDIRYEFFMEKGQLLSIGAFAKKFQNPIEIVRIASQQTSNEVQPRNVGNGQLLGLEVEFVKSLSFVSPLLTNFSLNGNFTYIVSSIDMTESEYNLRLAKARTGETIKNVRPMAGQAPWVINGGLVYTNLKKGINAGLFYNVMGPTLNIVGMGIYPDIYTSPFHSLNISLNKKFGAENRFTIGLKISNILNDKKEEIFQSYKAKSEYFNRLSEGQVFSLGFTCNLK